MFAGRKQKVAKREAFRELAREAATGDSAALDRLPAAVSDARGEVDSRRLDPMLWDALEQAVEFVGGDGIVSVEEENHLATMASALGLDFNDLADQRPNAFATAVVGMINDGRTPTLEDSPVVLQKSETAFGAFAVTLLKEVSVREWRGGSSGVSIPLGHGVRYRTASVRGRSVVIGTELAAADSGPLIVTSKRTIFAGSKKTLEFRHEKLVSLQEFTDGLKLGVSNRQATSIFRFARTGTPSIAAALINSATRST